MAVIDLEDNAEWIAEVQEVCPGVPRETISRMLETRDPITTINEILDGNKPVPAGGCVCVSKIEGPSNQPLKQPLALKQQPFLSFPLVFLWFPFCFPQTTVVPNLHRRCPCRSARWRASPRLGVLAPTQRAGSQDPAGQGLAAAACAGAPGAVVATSGLFVCFALLCFACLLACLFVCSLCLSRLVNVLPLVHLAEILFELFAQRLVQPEKAAALRGHGQTCFLGVGRDGRPV